jgi:hypothetical protein
MKKLFALAVYIFIAAGIFCISVGISDSEAHALSVPYAVIGDDVWLSDSEGTKLFLLPSTYYAQIESMDDNFYYIVFNGVRGKIPKGSVSVVGYEYEVKQTARTLQIASEYSVFTEIKLKSCLEGASTYEATIPCDQSFTFIGIYKQGDTVWYYVTYGGKYGYIKNTYTDTPQIVFDDFVPEKTPTEENEPITEGNEDEKKPELIKILVIGGASAIAVIFVIVLFIPHKGKRHKYYYS